MSPLVSVVIPTKNRRDLLYETLNGLGAQTCRQWEAIIVDDGSTDGTEEMVAALAAKDSRIRFLRRDRRPRGASTCRNIGLAAARGDYVIFEDSDDLLASDCLEGRVKAIEKDPALDFVVFLTQVFYERPGDNSCLWNNFNGEDDLDRFLRRDIPWHTSGPIWRRSSLAQIGPWDERALGSQDWEFHIRALAAGLAYTKFSVVDSYWRKSRGISISSYWRNRRHICNRARLARRIIAVLRSRNVLNLRRRRMLAAEFYMYAFVYNQEGRYAIKIWNAARRERLVGYFPHLAVMAGGLLVRVSMRISWSLASLLLPELRAPRTFLRATLPVAKK